MKYEILHDLSIPKLGFGTWKIGGGSYADLKLDSVSLAAIKSALEVGYTHFDTAEMYGGGHTEKLLGQAIRESRADRSKLFITSKVMPSHLKYDDVLKACENSLRRLKMEYIDLYLIYWPQAGMKLEETFRGLNKLIRDGKVRHLGVSNFNLRLLKESQALSETPLITNQVPYSLSDRSYVNNGVLGYCQQNDILLTAYEPVDKGRLNVNRTLQSIADAHNATPYQIALTWLISQPRVITIPMSYNPQHIRENFESVDIELTKEELEALN
ncbi:MAG: aldo/keto reductase [Anaerolineae bacterium]|nr:aldo/keto reductase [Anaerolineae bacterium]